LALAAVLEGGTIHVGASESFYQLSRMFVINKAVNIVGPGYDSDDLFDGSGAVIAYNDEEEDPAVIGISASDISISGLVLVNSGESYSYDIPVIDFVSTESPYTNIVIENNYIAGGYRGINFNEYISEIEITGNDITENLYGIYMIPYEAEGLDNSLFEIYHNRIYGNYSGVGLYVESNLNQVDVAENWWGDDEGPSVSMSENPEDIMFESGENSEFIISDFTNPILFRPFCMVADCTELSVKEVSAENIINDLFIFYFGSITVPFDELAVVENSEYTRLNVNEDLTITIPVTETNNTAITLPAGTVITNSSEEGTLDPLLLSAEDMDLSELSGFASGELVGAFQWGIPELGLAFDPAITVEMYVGEDLAGETLTLQRSLSTDGGWTQEGLIGVGEDIEDGKCLVDEGGICEFQTTLASYYGAIKDADSDDDINDDTENSDIPQKAKITSWKASVSTNTNEVSCPVKLDLKIKGKHFDEDAEVKIGNKKASKVDRKSSKEISAKFCLEKLLDTKTILKRSVSVINPDAETEKADKKINLKDFSLTNIDNSNPQSLQTTKDIQTSLVKLGYLESQYITGIYGPITTEAVKKFQADNGIEPTGFVGPLTKAKLIEKLQ